MKAKRDLEIGVNRSPRSLLGLTQGEDLKEGRHVPTPHGNQKIKYQETYKGLPVEGASIVMEKNQKGHFTSNVTGYLVENLDEDLDTTEPSFDANVALKILAKRNHDTPMKVRFNPSRDATLQVMLSDSITDTISARLVYKVSYTIENSEKLSRPFALIDADSGEILKRWEGLSLHDINGRQMSRVKSNFQVNGVGGNLKVGKTEYGGSFYKKLAVTEIGNGTCFLKNNVVKVYSCNSSWNCEEYQRVPFSFPCDEGFDDTINGAYSPLSDVLFYTGATYEMFSDWYNIENPLQRDGSNESFCSARVHFGTAFENAFWNGYYVTYGDGNKTFYPFTDINVVGHEIAHGITEMNSDLIYFGESGGLNEAFSDMTGEVVEFYVHQKVDWMNSYDIVKKPGKASRYFNEPNEDGHSIGLQEDYCPGMDPHSSSGVFNRAFYLLSVTKGWDPKKAFHPFVVANELYWMPHSTFFEAACGVVQAAKDLEMNADEVTEAFRKVGVEPCLDTRTGISAMKEITVPAGHKVIYHFNVEENMDIDVLSIKVTGPQVKSFLHTPGCDYCAANGHSNNIDVCNPIPGLYMLEYTSNKDIVKGAVQITGPTKTLLENQSVPKSKGSVMATFTLPESILKAGKATITMDVAKGPVIGLVRHGGPPSWEGFIVDFWLFPGDVSVICQTKPGPYYILFKSWNGKEASGIDLTSALVLEAKRIDKPPQVTRAPPTKEEGSGSVW